MVRLRFLLAALALLSLFAAGCPKEVSDAPKLEVTPAANMAPGQAAGMQYMKQHGGGGAQQAPR
jgi:nitrous oxide reductase accessory protein NosL